MFVKLYPQLYSVVRAGRTPSSALGVIILPFVSQGSKCQMWNSESFKLKNGYSFDHITSKVQGFWFPAGPGADAGQCDP